MGLGKHKIWFSAVLFLCSCAVQDRPVALKANIGEEIRSGLASSFRDHSEGALLYVLSHSAEAARIFKMASSDDLILKDCQKFDFQREGQSERLLIWSSRGCPMGGGGVVNGQERVLVTYEPLSEGQGRRVKDVSYETLTYETSLPPAKSSSQSRNWLTITRRLSIEAVGQQSDKGYFYFFVSRVQGDLTIDSGSRRVKDQVAEEIVAKGWLSEPSEGGLVVSGDFSLIHNSVAKVYKKPAGRGRDEFLYDSKSFVNFSANSEGRGGHFLKGLCSLPLGEFKYSYSGPKKELRKKNALIKIEAEAWGDSERIQPHQFCHDLPLTVDIVHYGEFFQR